MTKEDEKKIEIKYLSEKEAIIGQSRVSIIYNNIIFVEANETPDKEIALAHYNLYKQLSKRISGEIRLLVDLNSTGKISSEAKKIWKTIIEDESTGRAALFGLHPVAKVIASFVIGVTKRNNIRFFNNKEDALRWLRDK